MRSKLFSKLDSFCKSSLANSTLGWKTNTIMAFFSAYSSIYRKRHYRVPIVVFLTNATIVFVFQPKVEFAKLDFQKESNLLNNFKHMPRAQFFSPKQTVSQFLPKYSGWHVGLGIELANFVVSCCFIFLIHISALTLNHNN